jgi:hypothetical protein
MAIYFTYLLKKRKIRRLWKTKLQQMRGVALILLTKPKKRNFPTNKVVSDKVINAFTILLISIIGFCQEYLVFE